MLFISLSACCFLHGHLLVFILVINYHYAAGARESSYRTYMWAGRKCCVLTEVTLRSSSCLLVCFGPFAVCEQLMSRAPRPQSLSATWFHTPVLSPLQWT